MTEERTLQGVGVTGGVVVAPLLALRQTAAKVRRAGSPDEERAALTAACAAAEADLLALMEASDDDAADILAFQVALLDDEELLAPVLTAVAAGSPADAAWAAALDKEIADYRGEAAGDDGDDVFSARASDLMDLRDRVLALLRGEQQTAADWDQPRIVVAQDVTPSSFLGLAQAPLAGLALAAGSRSSHVSLLARARGLPLVVGLGALPSDLGAEAAVLDADSGRLILSPSAESLTAADEQARQQLAAATAAQALASRPAVTADGTKIAVLINVDHPALLADLDVRLCDGIGLTRTEFLFAGGAPTEEVQLAHYRRIVQWAEGRPVTIRTLDAGGDKPIPGITPEGEANPFLGLRGIRIGLKEPALLQVQFRALLQAATDGPLKVMLPMVTLPEEMTQARAIMEAVATDLKAEGRDFVLPPLGMMVEVPAAALAAAEFDADFYSIGTNDLIQYATACARDNEAVAALARADHPGVLSLIRATLAAGRARGVEVSLCGDMASQPDDLPLLLDAGLRSLSVAPAAVAGVKAAIAGYGRSSP